MRSLHIISLLVFLSFGKLIFAQDIDYARRIIDTLASSSMYGRGYVNHGDRKAAEFISGQFDKLGLKSFGSDYYQLYSFPINTFPGKVEATMNDKRLIPARDFIIRASTPSVNGEFRMQTLNKERISDPKKLRHFMLKNHHNKMVMIDKKGIEDKRILSLLDSVKNTNLPKAAGLFYINDSKLSWSVMAGASVKPFPVLEIKRESLPAKPKKIKLDIESEFIPNYQTQNVLGYVKGSVQPDTFLVFTAHYDHLGHMGTDAIFPGANDNASGTAMLIDMARHYSRAENKPYYSIAFFALSGEEAGLHGAEFCANNPPLPLSNIKFLMNMDMVGTGSEGITMVNATVFKDAYQRMVKINADNEFILTVKERGESCNSDHCPFYKNGVPAVFIYSMGKEFGEYHNPDDISSKLPLTEYKDIFRLVTGFMNSFQPAR